MKLESGIYSVEP